MSVPGYRIRGSLCNHWPDPRKPGPRRRFRGYPSRDQGLQGGLWPPWTWIVSNTYPGSAGADPDDRAGTAEHVRTMFRDGTLFPAAGTGNSLPEPRAPSLHRGTPRCSRSGTTVPVVRCTQGVYRVTVWGGTVGRPIPAGYYPASPFRVIIIRRHRLDAFPSPRC